MNSREFIERAKKLVYEYTFAHMDKTDLIPPFDAYKKFENKCIKCESEE